MATNRYHQPNRSLLSLLSCFTLISLHIHHIDAFKWHLSDTLDPNRVLTFSERYMFGNGEGPALMEDGPSYIMIDTKVHAYSTKQVAPRFAYVVYASDDDHIYESIDTCSSSSSSLYEHPSWAHNVAGGAVKTSLTSHDPIDIYDSLLGINGSYYLYEGAINYKYPVELTSWYNVAFKICDDDVADDDDEDVVARMDGQVEFRNPYGFIPGELWAFLPFEGARMAAYVVFGINYFYAYFRYKSSVLPLHHAIVVVYAVALAEATVWYAAYQSINLSGLPYCCPFPPPVVAALVLQVFRQTFSRTLLLVVSLGYGIVRPKLLTVEWIAVSVVSILYFIAALIGQVANIVITNDVHVDNSKGVLLYQFPSFIIDVMIITWIYYALGSTIRILTEFRQTAKLTLYKNLAIVIVVFVSLFAACAIVIMLDKSHTITWPWEYAWAKDVVWELLNFMIIVTVCKICMPGENSKLLSYASQLPTDDPDELEALEGPDMPDGDFSDDGDFEMAKHGGKDSYFSSLPAADDDEEYGLRED